MTLRSNIHQRMIADPFLVRCSGVQVFRMGKIEPPADFAGSLPPRHALIPHLNG
jgi:hypothetical protein